MAQNIQSATKVVCEGMNQTSKALADTPWDAPGYVEGSPSEIKTFPGFLPVDSIDWPAAILELRKSEQAHSQMGYFPTLQRAWLAVDGTFVMWNPFTGRDMHFYNELGNIIVAVGEPVAPKEGVFPSSVSFIIPIAADNILCFVGVQCRTHQGSVTDAVLVDLDSYISTPCMITHITCCHSTSDVVAGGSNGLLYLVIFSKSMFGKSIKLVAASSGIIPISAVSTFLHTIKTVVRGSDAAVMQVVCDQEADVPTLYTLSTDNTVSMYEIDNGTLKYATCVQHDEERVRGSTRLESDTISPLCNIYSVPRQGLVAVATSGERFIYSVTEGWYSASNELSIQHYIPSPLSVERLVTRAWCASNMFALSHIDSGDSRQSSQATLVAEVGKMPSVITNLSPTARDAIRIEAICEVRPATTQPEAVAQLLTGPRQLILLHHTGMLVYAKLRPLELLHLILLESAQSRERLLSQFFGMFSPSEYCCMLIHLATARRNTRRGITVGMKGPTHNAALYTQPSIEVRRLATSLLRSLCTPTVQDSTANTFSQFNNREVIVTLSEFAIGLGAYIAQIASPFWKHHIFAPGEGGSGAVVAYIDLAHEAELAMVDLQLFLESTNKELWGAPSFPEGVSIRWSRDGKGHPSRANVPLKANSVFSLRDRREVQNILISAIDEISKVVVQVHSFLGICSRLHPEILGRIVKENNLFSHNYSQICTTQNTARLLTRAVSREVASGRHVLDKEATLLLEEMESGATFLFGPTDKVEFNAVSHINAVLGAQSYTGVSEAIGQLCNVAGSIWRGGTLQSTVAQLTSHGLEPEAVRVLLAAASQVSSSDPSARYPSLMEDITGLLEAVFVRNPQAFQRLVGSPFHQGEMWLYYPQDVTTHRYLLTWLGASRGDTNLMDNLRATLIMVPSTELEPFLSHSTHQLGLLYVRYLHHRKGDADGAIQVCSRLIHDPLTTLPNDQRLAFRVSCAQEAAEISVQSNSPQRPSINHALRMLSLQVRVRDMVAAFLASGSSYLSEYVEGDSQRRTQKEKAEEHLTQAENEVMTSEAIFMTSMSLDRFGGVEIALETAVLCHSADSHLLGTLVEKALNISRDDNTARELLRRFGSVAGFPLTVLVMVLEARAFLRTPTGSFDVPRTLISSHVDAERAFAVYEALVERRDKNVYPCRAYEKAGVTPAYLVHSMAVLITGSQYPRQESDVATLYQIQRRVAETCVSPSDRAALESALALLQSKHH